MVIVMILMVMDVMMTMVDSNNMAIRIPTECTLYDASAVLVFCTVLTRQAVGAMCWWRMESLHFAECIHHCTVNARLISKLEVSLLFFEKGLFDAC